jgi:hypothetical protein
MPDVRHKNKLLRLDYYQVSWGRRCASMQKDWGFLLKLVIG